MVKLNVNLPKIISVADYHEFDEIKRVIKLFIKGVKITEIGFSNGYYQGLAYTGTITYKKNKDMYVEVLSKCKVERGC